nr:hormone prohormone-4a [Conus judaeus]
MNSFYPYSAAMMPFNSFRPPMHPISYLHPPMGYSFVYPAMNTMSPYNLMHPMYNPAHPMNHANPYSPMNPVTNLAHPMNPANPHSPLNPVTNLAHPMNPANPYSPMNPVTNLAHPMNPANPHSPLNPVTNLAHPMNPANPYSPMNPVTNLAHPMNPATPYNPMNPVNSWYNPMNFQYPFHPPMQVASYYLTPPLGSSYLFPSNGYGHFHLAPTQAAAPLNLHMHFPYSYQAGGMYNPYMYPYQSSALYQPYGYAAGVPGAMAWNQFGGAAWNPYSAMGYGVYPMWPAQFAHMWPLHPYYQTVMPAQEGMCSYDRPFKCWGSATCITIEAICDKNFDCNNHADEDPRICVAGRRPSYGILVSYLMLPNQQWMLQKLFNNVDPYTAAHALKLATSLGDLRWSLALTDENINNTKTVLEAVENDNKGPLVSLGMQASAWESVKFLMKNLLSTDFFLD